MIEGLAGVLITKDRHDRLRSNRHRLQGYPFPTTIVDGSASPVADLPALAGDSGRLAYIHLPGRSARERLLAGIERSEAELIMPLNDDDRFLPDCVARCVAFLERAPEYVAAQGSFWLPVPRRRRLQLEEYAPSAALDAPLARLRRHADAYAHTFYAVHRRAVLLRGLENAGDFESEGPFFELAQSFTTVGIGKVKRFTRPYCVREPNPPEHLVTGFKGHPRTWREREPREFDEELDRFCNLMSQRPPFAELGLGGGSAPLRELMSRYVDAASRPGGAPHQKYKHVIRLLNLLWPVRDAVADAERWSRSQRVRPVMDIAERAARRLGPGPWWAIPASRAERDSGIRAAGAER